MGMKNFVVLGDYDDSIHGWKYLKKVALKRGFFKSSVKTFMKGIVGKPAKLHCAGPQETLVRNQPRVFDKEPIETTDSPGSWGPVRCWNYLLRARLGWGGGFCFPKLRVTPEIHRNFGNFMMMSSEKKLVSGCSGQWLCLGVSITLGCLDDEIV